MHSADPTADKKQIWAWGCAVTPVGAHYVTAEELFSLPLTPILISGGLLEGEPLLSHPHLPMSPTNQSVWGMQRAQPPWHSGLFPHMPTVSVFFSTSVLSPMLPCHTPSFLAMEFPSFSGETNGLK